MTNRSEFLFRGGDPALDFLNTEIVRDGEHVDLLDTPESLSRWIAEAKLGTRVKVTPAGLAGAKRLRTALRELVIGIIEGRAVSRTRVHAINGELRRGRGTLVLKGGDRFSVEFDPEARDPRFLVARAAAEFLAKADQERIHRCNGANCILFFYDATKSGTRRWCSMAGCGNRMKASLHYQRKRGLLG